MKRFNKYFLYLRNKWYSFISFFKKKYENFLKFWLQHASLYMDDTYIQMTYILWMIVFILLMIYSNRDTSYHIRRKIFTRNYKNLPWIPYWMREILKNEYVFMFLRFLYLLFKIAKKFYYILLYFKAVIERYFCVFVLHHYSLVIFLKYIWFTILLFLGAYLLTKVVEKIYTRYKLEVILYRFINNLDIYYNKFKYWYLKWKKRFK